MAFGDVGHVLTNQNASGGSSSNTWVCYDNGGSNTGFTGTYLYKRDNATGGNIFNFSIKFNQGNWEDHGGDWPTHFGTSLTDSTQITPTSTYEDLYLYNGTSLVAHLKNPDYDTGSGGGINPLGSNPKIENLTFTKTSDTTLNVTFDWENLTSFTFSRADAGVNNVDASTGSLSGSSGTVNTSFHVSCQEGDLCWVHGNYSNNSLTLNPNIHGGMLDPYIFKVVEFSVSGTTLTVKTFLSGSTGLNNDADLRVNDPVNQVWQRVDYINYDGTLQTYNVTPFQRGFEYYVVDRSTGNDYGSRFLAPGKMRGTRGRTFW